MEKLTGTVYLTLRRLVNNGHLSTCLPAKPTYQWAILYWRLSCNRLSFSSIFISTDLGLYDLSCSDRSVGVKSVYECKVVRVP
jgi:hypothetical protein